MKKWLILTTGNADALALAIIPGATDGIAMYEYQREAAV